ncbi:MAG: hypothetical protein ABI305_08340 [Tepidiformaceae bacterium]
MALILGYVLAVPPLFVLRRIWRARWWPGYTAELVGALLIALGWAVKGNVGAVVINGAWALLFGVLFPLRAGRWFRKRTK